MYVCSEVGQNKVSGLDDRAKIWQKMYIQTCKVHIAIGIGKYLKF